MALDDETLDRMLAAARAEERATVPDLVERVRAGRRRAWRRRRAWPVAGALGGIAAGLAAWFLLTAEPTPPVTAPTPTALAELPPVSSLAIVERDQQALLVAIRQMADEDQP